MRGSEQEIARAREAAQTARARLTDTMSEIQGRLRPRSLLNDAWHGVRERGQDLAGEAVNLARAKPLTASAIVAAGIALLAREPIRHALAALFVHRRETLTVDEGSKPEATPPSPSGAETADQYEEMA